MGGPDDAEYSGWYSEGCCLYSYEYKMRPFLPVVSDTGFRNVRGLWLTWTQGPTFSSRKLFYD